MKDIRHILGIASSTSVILMILAYSLLHEPSPTRLPVRSPHQVVSIEPNEPVTSTEAWVFEPQDAVMSGDQFSRSFDFQGQLVEIEPVGPPGEMEYWIDVEDLRRRGFLMTESDIRDSEIGRSQKYNLTFKADNGAMISVQEIQVSAYGDCRIYLLLFKDGLYPHELRSLLPGAGIN